MAVGGSTGRAIALVATRQVTSLKVFASFVAHVDRIRAGLLVRSTWSEGTPGETLRDRMAQRLVEVALAPFAVRSVAAATMTNVDCSGWVVDFGRSVVRVAPRQLIPSISDFLSHWVYVTFCLLVGAVRCTCLVRSASAIDRAE